MYPYFSIFVISNVHKMKEAFTYLLNRYIHRIILLIVKRSWYRSKKRYLPPAGGRECQERFPCLGSLKGTYKTWEVKIGNYSPVWRNCMWKAEAKVWEKKCIQGNIWSCFLLSLFSHMSEKSRECGWGWRANWLYQNDQESMNKKRQFLMPSYLWITSVPPHCPGLKKIYISFK